MLLTVSLKADALLADSYCQWGHWQLLVRRDSSNLPARLPVWVRSPARSAKTTLRDRLNLLRFAHLAARSYNTLLLLAASAM